MLQQGSIAHTQKKEKKESYIVGIAYYKIGGDMLPMQNLEGMTNYIGLP